jgi:AcrR family transcriptional regulator
VHVKRFEVMVTSYAASVAGVREQRAQQTRERVIAAARALFAQHGYFNTSTNDIVVAAGVGTRGALYHHFADKQTLFRAVFEQVEVDLTNAAGETVSGASGFEVLANGLSSFLDASLDGEIRQILLIDGPAVLGWQVWREIEEGFGLGSIRAMLTAGQADGSIRAVDVGAMAHLLLSAVDEAALFIAHATDPAAAREQAGNALSALLAGVEPC